MMLLRRHGTCKQEQQQSSQKQEKSSQPVFLDYLNSHCFHGTKIMKAKQKTKHDAKFLLSFPRKSSEKHYLCGKNKKREMNNGKTSKKFGKKKMKKERD
jgi:hypothetical protein